MQDGAGGRQDGDSPCGGLEGHALWPGESRFTFYKEKFLGLEILKKLIEILQLIDLIGVLASKLVQEFFHPQYHRGCIRFMGLYTAVFIYIYMVTHVDSLHLYITCYCMYPIQLKYCNLQCFC